MLLNIVQFVKESLKFEFNKKKLCPFTYKAENLKFKFKLSGGSAEDLIITEYIYRVIFLLEPLA